MGMMKVGSFLNPSIRVASRRMEGGRAGGSFVLLKPHTHVSTRCWNFCNKSMAMADLRGFQLHLTCAALGFECQSCTFVQIQFWFSEAYEWVRTLHRPISDPKVNGFQESKNLLKEMQGCSMVLVLSHTSYATENICKCIIVLSWICKRKTCALRLIWWPRMLTSRWVHP